MNKLIKNTFLSLLLIFAVVGCFKDDDAANSNNSSSYFDIDFDKYAWIIEVSNENNGTSGTTRGIGIYYDDFDFNDVPEVQLKIDGTPYQLNRNQAMSWWVTSADLMPGVTYNFEFIADGKNYNADLKICHDPEVIFPDQIEENKDAHVTWTLEEDSKYQLMFAAAGEIGEDDEEYFTEIGTGVREFSFPANCVENWGIPGMPLELTIWEMNITFKDDLLLRSHGTSTIEYGSRW